MRLSEEKIKQAILHPEAGARERAVRYYARSHSEDPSIMPLVIKAVETYGKQDAYNLVGLSTALAQTADTISWIVDELNGEQSGSHEDYAFNLTRVLCDADPRPLAARGSQIVEARHFFHGLEKGFTERLEMLSWDAATCWHELEKICERGKNKKSASEVPLQHASHIIEALARMRDDSEERIRSVLSQKITHVRVHSGKLILSGFQGAR